jgi:DNA-binding beta-propeller fold protein YncE
MLKMTLFYGKIRVLSSNKMVNSAAVFTLAAIVLASTFASVNGQDSRVTTWGSLGSAPGQFDDPAGIVIDPKGYVFVVDSDNDRIQKFTSNGTFIGQWGTPGSGPGQLSSPIGIDEDEAKRNVYVTDLGNNRVQRFTTNGLFVSTWGSLGSGPGQFNNPGRIAVDPSGNLFVADLGNNRIQKFDAGGKLITMWGSLGSGPGQFHNPTGMTVQYPSGNVFVVDTGNSRIQEFDNNGKFIKQINAGTQFDSSDNIDLDVDSNGKIYLTDRNDDNIIIFSP